MTSTGSPPYGAFLTKKFHFDEAPQAPSRVATVDSKTHFAIFLGTEILALFVASKFTSVYLSKPAWLQADR